MDKFLNNIVYHYLDKVFTIDFEALDIPKDGRLPQQGIIISKDGDKLQLGPLVQELEMMFGISRKRAFWLMHDWLMHNTNKHVANSNNKEAALNLKYLLGWFTQML